MKSPSLLILLVTAVSCSRAESTTTASGSPVVSAAPTAAVSPLTLTKAVPMAGGLHVFWRVEPASCDAIDIERRSGTEPFRIVYTVPGDVDNKHDGSATAGEYVYRLRCRKEGASSAYSSELVASAKK